MAKKARQRISYGSLLSFSPLPCLGLHETPHVALRVQGHVARWDKRWDKELGSPV
jgi:hypothetical protein